MDARILQRHDRLSWANLDQADLIEVERDLAGRSCRLMPRAADWTIEMGDGRQMILAVPWRIVADGGIAFGSLDNGDRFRLTRPLDGKIETRLLLGGKRLRGARFSRETADVTLDFDDQTRLDAFNHSSGYEGWRLRCRIRGRWVWVIGSGGGHIRVVFLDN